MYVHFFKRLIDLFIAVIMLVVLSPLFLLILLLLSIANQGSPFFYQQRPGKHGLLFRVVKFKTMNDKKDVHGILLPDVARLTNIGKWVRKTSLDELPQLFNVIKGDMSIVGPRPLLEEYLPLYSISQARRHEVKPGITGWAQVNGRNAISWEEKFKFDVWYVDHVSLLLDLKILFLTVFKVVGAKGVNASTSVTMEKFTGTN